METDSRLHVRITDADHARWEVPRDVIPRPALQDVLLEPTARHAALPSSHTLSSVSSDLTFTIHTAPFRFTVTRRSTGDVLFETSATLVFKDRSVTLIISKTVVLICCNLTE
jgi:alpha-glucosidase